MAGFSIASEPGLLGLGRFLAWCYLEASARKLYSFTWESQPELREFFRQMTFTTLVVDQMWRLELRDNWEELAVESAADPGDDAAFLASLAGVLEEGDVFQFPEDPECQQVTDRVVARLRKIAVRVHAH
jgi:hypothetical protein